MVNRYGYRAATRPRDSGTVWAKFLAWNVWGEGKRLSSHRAATYWYRDDVFYANFRPKARVLVAPGGNTVVFIKRTAWFRGLNDCETIEPARQFAVDDIGVYGPYEPSMNTHSFLISALAQCIGRAKFMVEAVGHTAPREASQYFALKEDHDRKHHSYRFRCSPYSLWSDQIVNADLTYTRVNELFELGQPPVPFGELFTEFWRIVEDKAAIYNDPVNVKRRERTAARREAIEALRLEEGK